MKSTILIFTFAMAASSLTAAEIHDAVESGNFSKVSALLKQDASLVKAKDKGGNQALHLAAQAGDAKLAGLLLDAGADVNAKAKGGYTALKAAQNANSRDIVRLLVDHGAVE